MVVAVAAIVTITGFTPAGLAEHPGSPSPAPSFTGASSVKFNGIGAGFNIPDDTHINAYVPGSATTGLILGHRRRPETAERGELSSWGTARQSKRLALRGRRCAVVTITNNYFSNV